MRFKGLIDDMNCLLSVKPTNLESEPIGLAETKNLSNGIYLVNISKHNLLITLARLCYLKKYVVNLIQI